MAAGKIETFDNGTPYVVAGGWAGFFTWLIDFVVYLFGVMVGFVTLAVATRSRELDGGVIVLIMLGLLVGVPILYGLFYTNGRALGAVLTGTRLVRHRDGGRIGAKGPWAMLIRSLLLPVLLLAMVFGGGTVGGSMVRVSIDVARTRRLHAEGVVQYAPR